MLHFLYLGDLNIMVAKIEDIKMDSIVESGVPTIR